MIDLIFDYLPTCLPYQDGPQMSEDILHLRVHRKKYNHIIILT